MKLLVKSMCEPEPMSELDFDNSEQLSKVLEAVLLAAAKPLTIERIAELFDESARPSTGQIKAAFMLLASDISQRSYQLQEVASGFRLQVRSDYAPWVARLWEERPQRYSRAMLETLALIAYRQPITRGEIEDVRGVAVSSQIIKTLLEREWVRIVGYKDVPGKPAMLATTKAFLDYFNLQGLDELPNLSELKELQPAADELGAPVEAVEQQASVATIDEQPEHSSEQVSFSSLLAELDGMEQGLSTDFNDPALVAEPTDSAASTETDIQPDFEK